MIETVFKMSAEINENSGYYGKLAYLNEELGELATEIMIELGDSTKEPGDDGIVGEALDVMICALDIIYKKNPYITDEEIQQIVQRKCDKWKAHVAERKVLEYG